MVVLCYANDCMTVTLCGSIAFYELMQRIQQQLEAQGWHVLLPPAHVPGEDGRLISVEEYYRIRKAAGDEAAWVWERKRMAMKAHFGKIEQSDAILVVNETKNDVVGYVGANTLLEIGLAMHLDLPIYFLHPVPEGAAREELLGAQPTVLHGDVSGLAGLVAPASAVATV